MPLAAVGFHTGSSSSSSIIKGSKDGQSPPNSDNRWHKQVALVPNTSSRWAQMFPFLSARPPRCPDLRSLSALTSFARLRSLMLKEKKKKKNLACAAYVAVWLWDRLMYVIYAVTARDQPQLVRHWGCVMAALVSSWRLELYPQGSGFYVPALQSVQRRCRQSWTRDAWRHQRSQTRAIVWTETVPNMWISFRKGK